jgi:hypothetical protein
MTVLALAHRLHRARDGAQLADVAADFGVIQILDDVGGRVVAGIADFAGDGGVIRLLAPLAIDVTMQLALAAQQLLLDLGSLFARQCHRFFLASWLQGEPASRKNRSAAAPKNNARP